MISKETADYFNALVRMPPAQRHARMVREAFGWVLPGGFEVEVVHDDPAYDPTSPEDLAEGMAEYRRQMGLE